MATNPRVAGSSVEPLFLDRWSPRAFDGSAISRDDLGTIFDAARWAPSAFNVQPWRFLYSHRGSRTWATFLGLLSPFNQTWAERASALIFIVSDTLIDKADATEPSHSHSFDAGAAWALLALQAIRLGFHTHAMIGIDLDRTRDELHVPDRFRVEAAVAIGRMADKSILPERLQVREIPSDRKGISDFAFEGFFPG